MLSHAGSQFHNSESTIIISWKKNFKQLFDIIGSPKHRRIDSAHVSVLEESFMKNVYPPKDTRQILARQTGLSEKTIYAWFSNKRAKLKTSTCQQTSIGEDFLTLGELFTCIYIYSTGTYM